ncbi:hypothetical protein Acsp04_46820 [Actinomadura sp. NBRC 104425]|uniref:DUF2630 family protein n=1 Tax=Actinomadura sp. NBRC 104425 TaxID=3032204 RepID=UPI0024A0EC9F|nr:DUF2630 family protein [Actinomadura sp. NBRC 104425]GLZ14447.1 hypothetical protein Acsp04_46820 [Actinomadura sp. NBRC 104425]
MDEKDILERIGDYVAEEQRLRERYQRRELSGAEEHRRLRELEVALDRCWDLLRRRRARREAGQDPDDAEPRPAGEVEDYLQ